MILGARQFFERRGAPTPPLPYDAEVEYLESTGTQWIDTGIYGGADMRIVCSFCAIGNDLPNYPAVYGVSQRNLLGCYFRAVSGSAKLTYGALGTAGNYNTELGSWHVIEISLNNGRKVVFDGVVLLGNNTAVSITTVNPLRLFAGSNMTVSPPSTFGKGRISYFNITDTSTGLLIQDLISVRIGTGASAVGYMYDRVSGTLFGNAGTGAFTIGPDKS